MSLHIELTCAATLDLAALTVTSFVCAWAGLPTTTGAIRATGVAAHAFSRWKYERQLCTKSGNSKNITNSLLPHRPVCQQFFFPANNCSAATENNYIYNSLHLLFFNDIFTRYLLVAQVQVSDIFDLYKSTCKKKKNIQHLHVVV